VLDRADLILAEGRDAVLDLRDPDARISDLPESLTEVGNELAASNGPAFSTIVEGTPRPLSPIVRDEAYSIGREALINAFQHSQAAQIEVQLNYGQHSFTLQVRDDGKGIDATTLRTGQKAGHWGLTGMRERAREIGGKLDIWSGSRPGTEIQLQIPARIAYRPSDSVRVARWKFWRRRASAERH
ncbi:MAG TPA: ATP-binding protein, partial [Polyangiales bacterium]